MNEAGVPSQRPPQSSDKAVVAARASGALSLVAVLGLLAWLIAYPSATRPTATTSPTTPPATSAPSTTSSSQALAPGSLPSLVFGGPGVMLAAVIPGGYTNEGTKPSRLFLTTDGTTWTNVTPPQSAVNGTYPVFEHASFINASTGWVTAWNLANDAVTIYKTSDQGKTWTAIAAGSHSQAAGATELIDLVSPTTAYLEHLEPTGPGESLSVTTDGGATWHTVYRGPAPAPAGQQPSGPFMLQMNFANAATGFAAGGIPSIEPFAGGAAFYRTADGGSTWTRESPPLPEPAAQCPATLTGQSAGGCAYSLPLFKNPSQGVLAATVAKSGRAAIAFDTTGNGGSSWTEAASVSVAVPAGGTAKPPAGTGLVNFPLVSMPASATWWVLGWDSSSLISRVSQNAGSSWSRDTASMPVTGTPMGLAALDATHAVVMIATPTSTQPIVTLLGTSDGGRTWRQLQLPA